MIENIYKDINFFVVFYFYQRFISISIFYIGYSSIMDANISYKHIADRIFLHALETYNAWKVLIYSNLMLFASSITALNA